MSTSWGNMSRGWRRSVEKLVRRGPTPEEVARSVAERQEQRRLEAIVGVSKALAEMRAAEMEDDAEAAAGWLGYAATRGVA